MNDGRMYWLLLYGLVFVMFLGIIYLVMMDKI